MIQRIGRYVILQHIGRGGMGVVLKAHDPVLNRTVALKVISGHRDATDELRARFHREAQVCARLSHPNIVTVYDYGEIDGHLSIVMEFLEGEELRSLIAERRDLSLESKLVLMVPACEGLAYAHEQGVVHRDVKPGNIFILRGGGVKILDFGIARLASSDPGLTRTGSVVGTLRYMAPEQARGNADHRADIFSLGCVFYELLAYRPAFPGESAIEILEALRAHDVPRLDVVDPALPRALADIVHRMLGRDPAARVQDLSEVRRELEAIRHGLADEANALRDHLRDQRLMIARLQASLARLGVASADAPLPAIDAVSDVATLRALRQEMEGRREELADLHERATRLEPSVARGLNRLAARDFEAATADLEPVVLVLPTHSRAAAALAQAREGLDRRYPREAKGDAPTTTMIATAPAGVSPVSYAPSEEAAADAIASADRTTGGRGEAPSRMPGMRSGIAAKVAGLAGIVAVLVGGYLLWPRLLPRHAETVRRDSPAAKHEAPPAPNPGAVALGPPGDTAGSRTPPAAERDAARAVGPAAPAPRSEPVLPARPAEPRVKNQAWEGVEKQQAPPPQRPADSGTVRGSPNTRDELRGPAQESRRSALEEQPTPALKQELEQLKGSVGARREQAIRSEANVLTKQLFEGAEAKERDAGRFLASNDPLEARKSYQEAATRYDEAAVRAATLAGVRTAANQERARMLAAKQRAQPDRPEFATALSHERSGDASYERSGFKEATDDFRQATELFAKAVVTPPAPSLAPFVADQSSQIRATLDDFKRAFELRDLALMRRVRPSLPPDELRRMRESFDNTRSYQLDLRVETIEIRGDEAQARTFRQDVMVAKDGQIYRSEARVVFRLKRTSERWTIEDIK